jgi:hypothetical protein
VRVCTGLKRDAVGEGELQPEPLAKQEQLGLGVLAFDGQLAEALVERQRRIHEGVVDLGRNHEPVFTELTLLAALLCVRACFVACRLSRGLG